MATAKLIHALPPPPPAPEVELRLTMAEAEAVLAVLRRVGGDPETTRRGAAQRVYTALVVAGVPTKYPVDDLRGSLEFTSPIEQGRAALDKYNERLKGEAEVRRQAADKGICSGRLAYPQSDVAPAGAYAASGDGWATRTKPPIHRD